MRVLIVDDSKMIRVILRKVIDAAGIEVCEAGHGQEALAHLNGAAPFDLMLVDWNMPVMNGYDLVRAVRANPAHRAVRIIMLTMEGSADDVARAMAAGVDDYILKPFTEAAIMEKLAAR
jgi:two-component system chemotaxis response regulator CheY